MASIEHVTIDPDDPRAPTSEVWERLTPEERRRVVALLPADAPFERLGIPEYFVFDQPKALLRGFRLLSDPSSRVYQPILPQGGRYESAVLDLDLTVEAGKLRFYYSSAPVPETEELVAKLDAMVEDLVVRHLEAERLVEEERQRTEQERQRTEEERQRAEQERQRAEQAEQRAEQAEQRAEQTNRRVTELEAELERLRRG